MPKEKIIITGSLSGVLKEVEGKLAPEGYVIKKLPENFTLKDLQEEALDLAVVCTPSSKMEEAGEIIARLKEIHDSFPVIVISDSKEWDHALRFVKLGATEYLPDSVFSGQLARMVANHMGLYRLTRRVFSVEDANKITSPFEGMVGVSDKMRENFRMIAAVAKSNATVLVTGESGTGKELVAKAIHRRSERASFRFVDLNCGAIPRELLENELFGHEKGAFTGAHKRYQGSFETAHKGTLFLDEISEMDPLLQVKLLRVLQERSFMRIGGNEKIDVDVRIIAATNQVLLDIIGKGQFREDLYYRLNVVNINIPPLRERREDIPVLATHFLRYYSAKNDRIFLDFAPDAMEAFLNYQWPGNVRELENTVERIVVLHDDSQVKLKFLPKQIQKVDRSFRVRDFSDTSSEEKPIISLDEMERQAIEEALIRFHGNIALVAKKLKVGQATLYRKVKKYGIKANRRIP